MPILADLPTLSPHPRTQPSHHPPALAPSEARSQGTSMTMQVPDAVACILKVLYVFFKKKFSKGDHDASSRRSGMYSQKSYMQFFLKKNIYSHKSCTSSKVLFTVDYIYIHPHIYAMQVPDAVACVFKSPLDIDYMHSIHW